MLKSYNANLGIRGTREFSLCDELMHQQDTCSPSVTSAAVTRRETMWRSWAGAFLDPLNGGHRTDSRAGPQAGFDFQCGCFWATEDRAPNKNVCAYTCVRPSGHQRHSGQEMLQGPIRVCCEMKPHHQKRMLSGRGNDGYFLT